MVGQPSGAGARARPLVACLGRCPVRMTLLVTGGAGFIGSNFVHLTRATRPDVEVTVLDALTYAASRASLADAADGPGRAASVGDVADADAGRPAGRPTPTSSCTSPPSRTTTTRSTTRARSCGPTSSAPSRCSRPSAGTTCGYHHISTDEVYGDLELDDPKRSPRTRPTTRAQPVLRRPRPAPTCWCGPGCARFGLRATISNCSNNYGPCQHVEKFIPRQITNVLDGVPAQALRRRAQRARLDPRRRPQRAPSGRSSTRAGSARPT